MYPETREPAEHDRGGKEQRRHEPQAQSALDADQRTARRAGDEPVHPPHGQWADAIEESWCTRHHGERAGAGA